MSFEVFLTNDATDDLEDIFDYISDHDAPEKAEQVLAKIEKVLKSLSESPQRGAYPKELLDLGIRDYQQIHFKPYRMMYRIIGDKVYVLLIADGRRGMETLLQRRLLHA